MPPQLIVRNWVELFIYVEYNYLDELAPLSSIEENNFATELTMQNGFDNSLFRAKLLSFLINGNFK